jgi:hypothetical protein
MKIEELKTKEELLIDLKQLQKRNEALPKYIEKIEKANTAECPLKLDTQAINALLNYMGFLMNDIMMSQITLLKIRREIELKENITR